MYPSLTLVTGRMFLELLHNSLNIFSVRDPKRERELDSKVTNPII